MTRLETWAKQIGMFIALGAVAWLSESGQDGGFIKDLWSGAKTASPFAAMFAIIAWLSERKERQEAQRQCNERTIDFVQATNHQATAAEKVAAGLGQIVMVLQRRGRR